MFVALQRGLTTDEASPARPDRSVRRRDRLVGLVRATRWARRRRPGDWIGLSEITVVDDDTLAVIERDKLNGPDAKVKAVYTVGPPGHATRARARSAR